MEVQYTVFYSEVQSSNSSSGSTKFKIDNITTDVIYGNYVPESCSSEIRLTRKSSLVYKRSIYTRKNNGAPGYIKGSKILVGDLSGSGNLTYINQSSDGF